MLKAMIEKIEKMAGPKVYDVGNEHYASANLVRIDPKKDFPKSISLTGLDSVCKMVVNEAADLFEGDQILIQVVDYRNVRVFTTLDGEMDRCWLYECEADTPRVKTGTFMSHEEAVIQLRSLYIPNPDMEYLLKLLSSVSQESKVSSKDNGVSQTVEARTGVALTTNLEVRPYVNLQPFRTFLEVPQPESMFLLRLDNNGQIALIEADGGVWKLEATRNISAYFEKELGELIEDGRVVVLR